MGKQKVEEQDSVTAQLAEDGGGDRSQGRLELGLARDCLRVLMWYDGFDRGR